MKNERKDRKRHKCRKSGLIRLLMAAVLIVSAVLVFLPAMTQAAEPTIDTSRPGSITIHKYEYNGNGGTGTGQSTDTPPSGAKPLGGVTFKIAKVYDLTDYYKTDGNSLPSLTNAQSVSLDAAATTGDLTTVGNWKEITTVTDGTAKIENLSLGIYLVSETSAPSQITGKAAPFLVSIPMTASDGQNWLYDVHVYPKNSSTYSSISLYKEGQNSADSSQNQPLGNAKFILQRKKTDGTFETITTDAKGTALNLTTGNDGILTVNDLGLGTYRFIETETPDGYIMDGDTTYGFEIKQDTNGVVSVVIDPSCSQTAYGKIKVTNYKPDLTKKVKKGNDWEDAADYTVGDIIPFRVAVYVPENLEQLTTFSISDTLTNMQLANNTNFKVYSDANCTSEILAGLFSKPNANDTSWTITFDKNDLKTYKNTTIYIYYEAQLSGTPVNTSTGNLNTATLTYSHEIIPNATDTDNPNTTLTAHTDTISDQAVVYTFNLTVEKVDGSDTNTKLKGVKFDLYKEDLTSSDTITDPETLNSVNVKKIKTALETDANGKISENLSNGTYYLVETQTVTKVDGKRYNLLKNPVKIKINASYGVTKTPGTPVTTYESSGVYITTSTKTNIIYGTYSGAEVTQTVKNYTGFLLPQTGGIGTIVFVFVGVSMMVAAAVLFYISHRKKR